MIRTRFAPSPTGFLHVGNLRTALFEYLFARKSKGVFLVRIEDTDQERFVEGGVENILHSLQWAGIEIDEGVMMNDGHVVQKGEIGPYIQSERRHIYQEYVQKLLDSGHAYYAFDSKEALEEMRHRQEALKRPTRYERNSMINELTIGREETMNRVAEGEPYAIRLKVPVSQTVSFHDCVRGTVEFNSDEIDDQVLMKSDGFPTYHLAVVVDDHLMGITHVIRGEDWLPSTPKHILLYQAFGWETPVFAHLPLLVNAQKKKLSKREGDVSVEDFKAKGYLPEAIVNFIAFLGWNPGNDQEIFSLAELEKEFDLDHISKSAAVFNLEKLGWYNKKYMLQLDLADLTERAIPFFRQAGVLQKEEIDEPHEFEFLQKVVALERGRATTLVELVETTGFIFAHELIYEPELLVWKKSTREDAKEKLAELMHLFSTLPEGEWGEKALETKVKEWIETSGYELGHVLWPMRVALSGQKNSPGPFEIATVLGKEKTLERITLAIQRL